MNDSDYTRMVRHWQRPVFTVLARITGQPTAVEQLALETFADAFNQLAGSTGTDQRRLLFRIALKHATEFLRRSPARNCPVLDALEPELRALLVLAETEDLSASDLSFIAGVPPDSVERRLREARRRVTGSPRNFRRESRVVMSCVS